MRTFNKTRVSDKISIKSGHAVETHQQIKRPTGFRFKPDMRTSRIDETLIARVIEYSACRDDMHGNIAIRQIAVPGNREDFDLMALLVQFPGDAQHVPLRPAEWKILEDQERKLQSADSLNKDLIVCENNAHASNAHRQDQLHG